MFRQVTDVAWDKFNNAYISDGYINSRIAKVDKDGKWLKSWGEPGSKPGQFDTPHSIALDANGSVYVADRGNRRIQVFNGEGTFLRQITIDVPFDQNARNFQILTVWKTQSDGPARSSLFSLITSSERTHLLSGKSIVRVQSCSQNATEQCVRMMKMIDIENPASGLLVGEVDSPYLWSADKLPSGFDLCVLGPGHGILYSSNPDETASTERRL
jgi:hypothetical protein